MTTSAPRAAAGPTAGGRRELRRVAVASFVGTTVEWYDFYLYGTAAALVLGPQFFPGADPLVGVLASFSTYAVGFVARPVGGIAAGHLGDRVGRKAILVASLLLMGLATTAIGLLPTYATAGVLAPILLIALRLAQGLAAGAEWGGAALMSVEHAGARRRGLFGSFTQAGSAAGMVLASGGFALTQVLTTQAQFTAWGWRVPFLASIVLVVVGLVVRLGVAESPLFAKAKADGALSRRPVVDVVRDHPRTLALTVGLRVGQNALYVAATVFGLSYLTTEVGADASVGLAAVLVASVLGLGTAPLWGWLSDRVGRRSLYRTGAVFSAAFVVPFFLLLDTGAPWLVILAFVLAINIGHDLMYAPQAAWFAELFGTGVRASGASLGYSVGAVLGGGLTPLVATWLLDRGDGEPWLVAAYLLGLCLVTTLAAWRAPETLTHDLAAVPAHPTPAPITAGAHA